MARNQLTKMTENKPSKDLWALSSLAATMGVLNAIDACNRGDLVKLDAQKNGNGKIRIDVVDPEGSIFAEIVARIFEPLFTTKQGGNGLGLAIAQYRRRLRQRHRIENQ